jgi:hypothetical protein
VLIRLLIIAIASHLFRPFFFPGGESALRTF